MSILINMNRKKGEEGKRKPISDMKVKLDGDAKRKQDQLRKGK